MLQVVLSNFTITAIEDVEVKEKCCFIRITCGDETVETDTSYELGWRPSFQLRMPLSMSLSGDRVATEPVKFEVFERDPGNTYPLLIGARQVELGHLCATSQLQMDLSMETWSAKVYSPPHSCKQLSPHRREKRSYFSLATFPK